MPLISNADLQWIMQQIYSRGASALSRPCPECTQVKWKVSDDLHFLPVVDVPPAGTKPTHTVYVQSGRACVVVNCAQCGYMKLYDVQMLGYQGRGMGATPAKNDSVN